MGNDVALRRGPGRRPRSAATATTGSPAAPATTASSATTAASRRAATARSATRGATRPRRGSSPAPATPRGTCLAEPLNGVAALLADRPGHARTATATSSTSSSTRRASPDGDDQRRRRAQQVVNLTPFNVDPLGDTDTLFDANGYDDIIFGGLGNDFLHGGSGDDAMSGAEALPLSYVQVYSATCPQDQAIDDCVIGLVRLDYGHPWNAGDIAPLRRRHEPVALERPRRRPPRRVPALQRVRPAPRDPLRRGRHGLALPGDLAGRPHLHRHRRRRRRRRPVLPQLRRATRARSINGCVETSPSGSTCLARADAKSDGDDVIFGDLGNDWLVGGTGKDTLWGGCGNDLLERRRRPVDRLRRYDANGGKCTSAGRHVAERRARHAPDLRGPRLRRRRPRHPDRQHRRRPPDRLGRRVQQLHRPVRAVRDRDRQPPGAAGAVRVPLRALEGAGRRPDARGRQRRIVSAPRNGEPYGEIGLVTQKDHGLWQQQTGSPTDPQAGNIPGGRRDVLRTANFNDGTLTGFAPDSGVWEVTGGDAAGLGRVARQGRGRRLLRRPDAAGLLRAPRVRCWSRSRPAAGTRTRT